MLSAAGSIILSFLGLEIFHYITVIGIAFLWLALAGFIQAKKKPDSSSVLLYIPYYFMLVNIRSLLGIISALKGNIQVTWSTPRTKQDTSSLSTKAAMLTCAFLLCSGWVFLQAINKLLT